MNVEEVQSAVATVINRVLTDSGRPAKTIQPGDTLTGTLGLDSLDLAVLVVGLEQSLGVDPFRTGAQPVRSVEELVELYRSALAAKDGA